MVSTSMASLKHHDQVMTIVSYSCERSSIPGGLLVSGGKSAIFVDSLLRQDITMAIDVNAHNIVFVPLLSFR